MPTNDHPTTGLYLRGLLATGARPFPPPSSVYRLLGQAPPRGAAMRFPPPLPPVGFVYEGLARLRPEIAELADRDEELEADRVAAPAELARTLDEPTSPTASAGTLPPPALPQRVAPSSAQASGGGGVRAAESGLKPPNDPPREVLPRLAPPAEPGVAPAPSLGAEPPGVSVAEQASVQEEAAAALHAPEKRSGLAIPGLTQRRSIFAALAGTLPREGATQAPEAPATEGPAPFSAGKPTAADPPSAAPALQPSRGIRPAPRSGPSAPDEEGAVFRARRRVKEEVERVRRVVAPSPGGGAPEAVREAVREAVQETVREERVRSRPEEPSARRDPPATSPVVVVHRVEESERRAPRAFWSSSVLRSRHLRMLR